MASTVFYRIVSPVQKFRSDENPERDLAALVGIGLPPETGFARVRDYLSCRSCGKRGTTLHHVIPAWVCRATGAREVLESLCPRCHAAAEVLARTAAESVLGDAELLSRIPKAMAAAAVAWRDWVRWDRRCRNLETAGRDTSEAIARRAKARRRLGPQRERLRNALRAAAARLCLERIRYLDMVEAWRKSGVGALNFEHFISR